MAVRDGQGLKAIEGSRTSTVVTGAVVRLGLGVTECFSVSTALGHAAGAFGSLCGAAAGGERCGARLFFAAFEERGVLSIAPHSETVVEFMARAASSWYVRKQELVHRLFEQACLF